MKQQKKLQHKKSAKLESQIKSHKSSGQLKVGANGVHKRRLSLNLVDQYKEASASIGDKMQKPSAVRRGDRVSPKNKVFANATCGVDVVFF